MRYLAYLLLVFTLVTPVSFAGDKINGYFEAKKYFKTNVPEYPDLQGGRVRYGLDFELRFPTQLSFLQIMAGADSNVGPRQFSQIAGRVGLDVKAWSWNAGVFHRSNHSLDHTPKTPFLSDNHLYIRYNFEVGNK